MYRTEGQLWNLCDALLEDTTRKKLALLKVAAYVLGVHNKLLIVIKLKFEHKYFKQIVEIIFTNNNLNGVHTSLMQTHNKVYILFHVMHRNFFCSNPVPPKPI